MPLEPVAWLISARMPANVGAPTEVPPTASRRLFSVLFVLLDRKPFAQLVTPVVPLKKSCEQTRYGSWPLEAFRAMSGTSRLPSPGTPVPLCHDGLEKIVLAPPPPALRPLELVSFHVFSGMYSRADGPLVKFEELFQY